ncbi:MAG: Uma2 family endonuclease [Polyangiaceae bacterium]
MALPKELPEQRMLIYGVRWKDYVILREALDTPGLRMTYCEGALELMSPSRTHELRKTTIARLVELYAVLCDLPLVGYGSTTFRNEAKERGAEPDECYRVGTLMKDGEIPDIALEVIHASPLLDKLHVYRGLAVPEIWLFEDSAFKLYRLGESGYESVERSGFLPDLDFTLIAELAVREDQHEALRELRIRLGSR